MITKNLKLNQLTDKWFNFKPNAQKWLEQTDSNKYKKYKNYKQSGFQGCNIACPIACDASNKLAKKAGKSFTKNGKLVKSCADICSEECNTN